MFASTCSSTISRSIVSSLHAMWPKYLRNDLLIVFNNRSQIFTSWRIEILVRICVRDTLKVLRYTHISKHSIPLFSDCLKVHVPLAFWCFGKFCWCFSGYRSSSFYFAWTFTIFGYYWLQESCANDLASLHLQNGLVNTILYFWEILFCKCYDAKQFAQDCESCYYIFKKVLKNFWKIFCMSLIY